MSTSENSYEKKHFSKAILYYNKCGKTQDVTRIIIDNPEYFLGYVLMKENENEELRNENLKLKEENEELRYRPGNIGYTEAKQSFEKLSNNWQC